MESLYLIYLLSFLQQPDNIVKSFGNVTWLGFSIYAHGIILRVVLEFGTARMFGLGGIMTTRNETINLESLGFESVSKGFENLLKKIEQDEECYSGTVLIKKYREHIDKISEVRSILFEQIENKGSTKNFSKTWKNKIHRHKKPEIVAAWFDLGELMCELSSQINEERKRYPNSINFGGALVGVCRVVLGEDVADLLKLEVNKLIESGFTGSADEWDGYQRSLDSSDFSLLDEIKKCLADRK